MSAAPSWPLICAAPAVRANLPNARLPPPYGLNFSNRPDRPKPDFGDFVPISFFEPSKRKTTRGAHYRTRPSQPFISRTAKSPKSDRLPTACAGNPAVPVTVPCFPAAVPIWGGGRGDSRGNPSNPHTFLCTPCSGTPRSTLLALPQPGYLAPGQRTYLSSTLAPAFSSWALILSASSLLTPSLTGFGAPSTRSLASFRPRPVMARTSLMTSIFLSPAAARTTVNSVFSSAGAAAAPPPAGPATATAAAADTPHFSSRSFASSAASSTVRLERSSTIFCKSAIDMFP